jgi:hypothetical protein
VTFPGSTCSLALFFRRSATIATDAGPLVNDAQV